jgi:hypothetical protein
MIWLNVTAILQDIRNNAERIGVDLFGPILPPPGDPLYEELVKGRRVAREKALVIVREHQLATN